MNHSTTVKYRNKFLCRRGTGSERLQPFQILHNHIYIHVCVCLYIYKKNYVIPFIRDVGKSIGPLYSKTRSKRQRNFNIKDIKLVQKNNGQK